MKTVKGFYFKKGGVGYPNHFVSKMSCFRQSMLLLFFFCANLCSVYARNYNQEFLSQDFCSRQLETKQNSQIQHGWPKKIRRVQRKVTLRQYKDRQHFRHPGTSQRVNRNVTSMAKLPSVAAKSYFYGSKTIQKAKSTLQPVINRNQYNRTENTLKAITPVLYSTDNVFDCSSLDIERIVFNQSGVGKEQQTSPFDLKSMSREQKIPEYILMQFQHKIMKLERENKLNIEMKDDPTQFGYIINSTFESFQNC